MSESSFNQAPVVIAAPAQAFFHLVLTPNEDRHKLSFSVKDETNIRYYLIEGSHDMLSFDPLSRIYAKGSTDLPRTYNATIYNTDYSYYRVRQVDTSNAAIFSSTIDTNLPQADSTKKDHWDLELQGATGVAAAYAW